MTRRPRSAAVSSGGVTVVPHDRGADLPPLDLRRAPRTPAEVVEVAVAYADESAGSTEIDRARLVRAAYRAAMLVAGPSVKRAEIVERLNGVNGLADALD